VTEIRKLKLSEVERLSQIVHDCANQIIEDIENKSDYELQEMMIKPPRGDSVSNFAQRASCLYRATDFPPSFWCESSLITDENDDEFDEQVYELVEKSLMKNQRFMKLFSEYTV